MKTSKLIFYLIAAVVLVLVVFIAKESFFQPGMERFEGKYKELTTYRNENNTGPVLRIYAVEALDTSQDWMREYGDAMPHTKYGRTLVFFLSPEVKEEFQLSSVPPYFDSSAQSLVIATYQKSPMGEVSFMEGYQQ